MSLVLSKEIIDLADLFKLKRIVARASAPMNALVFEVDYEYVLLRLWAEIQTRISARRSIAFM